MLGQWVGSDRLLQGKVALEKQIKIYWGRNVADVQQIIENLKSKGYNNNAITAILANIDVETDSSFDYKQKQSGGGPGRGLIQMETLENGRGMFDAYTGWLETNNLQDSVESQINYLHALIQGTDKSNPNAEGQPFLGAGNAKKIRNSLMSDTNSIDKMTIDFMTIVENPGVEHRQKRLDAAKYYQQLFSSSTRSTFANQASQDAFIDIMNTANIEQRDNFIASLDNDLSVNGKSSFLKKFNGATNVEEDTISEIDYADGAFSLKSEQTKTI